MGAGVKFGNKVDFVDKGIILGKAMMGNGNEIYSGKSDRNLSLIGGMVDTYGQIQEESAPVMSQMSEIIGHWW